MEEILSFGEWLLQRRRALDLTRQELARLAGCSVAALRKIEADERKPSKELAERLADYLALDSAARILFIQSARGQLSPAQLPPPDPRLAISSPNFIKPQGPKTNLPSPATRLVGREADAANASALLAQPAVRLVTFLGPPGVGKTRLALQVAHELQDAARFKDGVLFVLLAPIRDPDLVLSAISHVLGIRASDSRFSLDQVKAFLSTSQMLLVLDNFEQVVGAAPMVGELLAAAPGLKVLVTSREVLHLYGEHEFTVRSLALPNVKRSHELGQVSQSPAVSLFLERARAVQPHFQVTDENAHAVSELCMRLDGLPLAIELAAARVKLFSPQRILELLDSRTQFLVSEARDLPARQRTLRGAIAWSYELLDAVEQNLFRRVSVFVGGFTLKAAHAVLGADLEHSIDVFQGLVSLLDKSLVVQQDTLGAEPRFTLLETIRDYGQEQLEACGETAAVHQRHATYYLALVERANVRLFGAEAEPWLVMLEAEYGNLLAALDWAFGGGDAEVGIQLALALAGMSEAEGNLWSGFWNLRGYNSEGHRWLELVGRSDKASPATRAATLLRAGWYASLQGELEQGRALDEEALLRFREQGDALGVARALTDLGRIAWDQSEYARANALLTESLAQLRKLDDHETLALAVLWLACTLRDQGEHMRAKPLFEENLVLWQELGTKGGAAIAFNALGEQFLYLGDDLRAEAHYEEALVLSRDARDEDLAGLVLCNLGRVALARGDDKRARELVEEGVALLRERTFWGIFWALHALAYVLTAQGDYGRARDLLSESLRLLRPIRAKWLITHNLEHFAGLEARQLRPERAVHLYGAAETLRESIGRPRYPLERADYERDLASARATLDPAILAAAWEQGRKTTLEEAIEYALQEVKTLAALGGTSTRQ